MTDSFDDLLADALHDDRLALPVCPDTLPRVRRSRAHRQRARAVGAVAATGSLVFAGVLLIQSIGPATPSSSLRPAAGGATVGGATVGTGCNAAPPATPIPGSTPAYPIRTAQDWLMKKAQSDAFFSGYQQPSPQPGDTVPSPQAPGPDTDRLVAELTAAGVPGAEVLDRDEADSGNLHAATLKGSLADGRQLSVYRQPLLFPLNTDGIGSDGSSRYVTVERVPDTACTALVYTGTPAIPGDTGFVSVVTPTGIQTTWNSPTIPLTQLRTWAFAAAQWASTHPG